MSKVKGRLLTKSEVMELKDGTEVWVESISDNPIKLPSEVHVVVGNRLMDVDGFSWNKSGDTIAVYEWVEEKKSNVVITYATPVISPIEKIEFKSVYGSDVIISYSAMGDILLDISRGTQKIDAVINIDDMREIYKSLGIMLGGIM